MGYTAAIRLSDYVRKDNTQALYLRVIIDRAKIKFPLEVYLRKDQINLATRKVLLEDEKTRDDLQLIIDQAYGAATDIFINYRLAKKKLTTERFKREYDNPALRYDFVSFMELETREIERGEDVSKPTIATYKTTLGHLKKYQDLINFMDMDQEWAQKFDRALRKQKLSLANRMKQHKNVKKFINLAIRRGVRMTDPYQYFKIQRIKSNPTFLTVDEVQRLVKLYHSNDLPRAHHETLRTFLFACFTGPRYSDVSIFTLDNIENGELIYVARKTLRQHKEIRVPLSKMAIRFLTRLAIDGRLFKQISIQPYNRQLKVIADYAGIHKKVTSHVARHTFATMFLEFGGRVETLQQLLGHADISTTMIYVHITDQRKQKEMAMMDGFEIKNPRHK